MASKLTSMFYRHKIDLPKKALPNAALLGWELIAPSDGLGYTCYEAFIPFNSTIPLVIPSDMANYSHIYYCMSGDGMCTFDDGEKHPIESRHIVGLSPKESCKLNVSSQDGMRLFVLYCVAEDPDTNRRVIRSVKEINGTERDNDFGQGHSYRLMLKCDGFSVGFNNTIINPGAQAKLQYRNHVETNYFYIGGEIKYIFDDETVESKIEQGNGTMICVNSHEKHTADRSHITSGEDAMAICIFTPPLVGKESHSLSADGYSSYDLLLD